MTLERALTRIADLEAQLEHLSHSDLDALMHEHDDPTEDDMDAWDEHVTQREIERSWQR